VHRGQREPDPDPVIGTPVSEHAHLDRHDVPALRAAIERFEADALVDDMALTATDADEALSAAPASLRLLVLSSMDVYRAFSALPAGTESDGMPLDETSPVRPERYPYRGKIPKMDDYEKLDVEERYRARGGTAIRLPMIYGEHDPQRREEPILRRLRAGRTQLPIGAANWLWTRGYVRELARGNRLALEHEQARGEVFNLGEARTPTMRAWIEQVVAAAGGTLELVPVDERRLPPDLGLTAAIRQHLIVDSGKARALLGWVHADPAAGVERSVRWHLAHPPAEPDADFSADDRALATRIDRDDVAEQA
jgi:nucleoside-diphosphate-sugar epimerase